MRYFALIALVFLLVAGRGTEAPAESRVALVIGNAAYQANPLSNPRNDAALMTKTLLDVGFDVISVTDADLRGMRKSVRDFGRRLRAAGPKAVGLFYFAGHGIQARGANYLMPLNAEVGDEADLDIEAISANDVLSQMESAGNALNLMILDACRDNPFAGRFRSASRGLTRVQAASGTLIAFAAAPGQVAEDGPRRGNSPYTAALSEAILKPGVPVEQAFKQVRLSVRRATGGRQTPWEESSILGDFYFIPSTSGAPAQATSTAPPPTAPEGVDERQLDLAFWESIKGSNNPAAYESYLAQFPNGVFSGLARVKVEELRSGERNEATLSPPAKSKEPDPVRPKTPQPAATAPATPKADQPPQLSLATGRFHDNRNGTILDSATNLVWQNEAYTANEVKAAGERWGTTNTGKARQGLRAGRYCQDLRLAGHSDWRVPSVDELKGLIAKGQRNKIDPAFRLPETPRARQKGELTVEFWTGSKNPKKKAHMFYVLFGNTSWDGSVHGTHNSHVKFVRCVRNAR